MLRGACRLSLSLETTDTTFQRFKSGLTASRHLSPFGSREREDDRRKAERRLSGGKAVRRQAPTCGHRPDKYDAVMAQALPPPPPAIHKPVEPQYPLGGFVFSGSDASLAKLKAAGDAAGLRLKRYTLKGHPSSLVISGDDAFGKFDAVMALRNKASKGTFGQITGGLISEPPPSR